jgi:hypothetical protein
VELSRIDTDSESPTSKRLKKRFDTEKLTEEVKSCSSPPAQAMLEQQKEVTSKTIKRFLKYAKYKLSIKILRPCYLVNRIDFLRIGLVINLNQSRIFQEIDIADLTFCDIQSCTFFDVSQHLIVLIRSDQINLLVLNQFAGTLRDDTRLLHQPSHEDEEGVGGEQFQITYTDRQRIDDRETNDEEEVSHLTDRHRVRTITDDTEDGEETQRQTDLQFLASQEEDQQEDRRTNQRESEDIITSFGLAVIEPHDNQRSDKDIKSETKKQLKETFRIHDRYTENRQISDIQ